MRHGTRETCWASPPAPTPLACRTHLHWELCGAQDGAVARVDEGVVSVPHGEGHHRVLRAVDLRRLAVAAVGVEDEQPATTRGRRVGVLL